VEQVGFSNRCLLLLRPVFTTGLRELKKQNPTRQLNKVVLMKSTCKLLLPAIAVSLGFAMSANASITYSGTALQGLDYSADLPGATASYVAGTPDYAYLYTPDSGITVNNGGGEVARVGVTGPFGTLNNFSASYSLYTLITGPVGPGGNAPYWVIFVRPTGDSHPNDDLAIIQLSTGPTLNGASTIHAYGPGFSSLTGNLSTTTWGDTLTTLDGITYNGVAFGDMTVESARVEIGEWDNGSDVIPATANIDSITISSVPEPTTMIAGALLLLPFGASTIRILRRNRMA
jgi:hypothetical protein